MALILNSESTVIDIIAKEASLPITVVPWIMDFHMVAGSQPQGTPPSTEAYFFKFPISANSSKLGDCYGLCGFVLEP